MSHACESRAQLTKAREMFQHALVQPVVGLEKLMTEYEAWEAAMGGTNSRQVLQELSEKANVARRVARERATICEGLSLEKMPERERGTDSGKLAEWRRLWLYEASNPSRLTDAQLQLRSGDDARAVKWLHVDGEGMQQAAWRELYGGHRALIERAVRRLQARGRMCSRSDCVSRARRNCVHSTCVPEIGRAHV